MKVYIVYVPEKNQSLAIDSVWKYKSRAEKRAEWLTNKALLVDVTVVEYEVINTK